MNKKTLYTFQNPVHAPTKPPRTPFCSFRIMYAKCICINKKACFPEKAGSEFLCRICSFLYVTLP